MNAPESAIESRRSGWTTFDVADALNCAVYGPITSDDELAGRAVTGVAIDSRMLQPGMLFVALVGTREHGLVHAAEALDRGAAAVLVGNDPELDDSWDELVGAASVRGPVLATMDCDGVIALGRLARAWRRRLGTRVVGITGSSGKTSTKDMLGAMLESQGVRVVSSHANWNNEIGVPLTLLAADAGTDVVICEMGMRGAGQITYLCGIAQPDIGIVTNAGSAHLELLGSREAIRAAKAELFAGTWAGGTIVYPAIQPDLPEAADQLPDRALSFGGAEDEDAAVRVLDVRRTDIGIAGAIEVLGEHSEFALPVHGVHQSLNLAAAACGMLALVGSPEFIGAGAWTAGRITSGRGDRHELPGGGVLIDDAYNANPESMHTALDELSAVDTAARRVAVLGSMAELGPTTGELHADIGAYAASLGEIDLLVVVRASSEAGRIADAWNAVRDTPAVEFDTVHDAVAAMDSWLDVGDCVLVKASNSAGLARIAAQVRDRQEASS